MRVIELTVFYRELKTERKQQITEAPDYQDVEHIKLQVGRMIKKVVDKAEYYYVVIGVEKSGGGKGYRTIIPKTVVE